jgi:dTDP-4-amino-4,6-dideoxygalactose transaminase
LFNKLLENFSVFTPATAKYSNHVYHQYAVRIEKNRDAVLQYMQDNGVGCAVHYPKPIHLQQAYEFMGLKAGAFPVSERLSKEIMSLPVYPELSEEQVKGIASTLEKALGQ